MQQLTSKEFSAEVSGTHAPHPEFSVSIIGLLAPASSIQRFPVGQSGKGFLLMLASDTILEVSKKNLRQVAYGC